MLVKDKGIVLLLGGTGTLSSLVLGKAISVGYDVVIMNRGKRRILHQDSVEQIICDFFNINEIIDKFSNRKFDVIVDFLSRTPKDIERIYPFFANRCRQYIFISSACVYKRDKNDFPLIESSPKPNEQWQYNILKYECEKLLCKLSGEYRSAYTILRPYITYDDERIPLGIAPPYHYHRTIIERLKAGKPWFVWDDGKAVTTLTHADDFARAVVGLFLNEKAFNEDFHITSSFQCPQIEVVTRLFRILGVSPQILSLDTDRIIKDLPEYKGMLLGDRSLDAIFDNSKLLSAIPGFHFEISIQKGLERVVSYWQTSGNYDYDYRFEGRIDKMLRRSRNAKFVEYERAQPGSKKTYWVYRHLPLRIASRIKI